MGFFLSGQAEPVRGSGVERMAERPYLSIEDVAKRFGVTPSTVYRLAQRGVLPAFKVGGQWRVSHEMLELWVADQVTVERLKAADQPEDPSKPSSGHRQSRKK